jgi:hypothetical protein
VKDGALAQATELVTARLHGRGGFREAVERVISELESLGEVEKLIEALADLDAKGAGMAAVYLHELEHEQTEPFSVVSNDDVRPERILQALAAAHLKES